MENIRKLNPKKDGKIRSNVNIGDAVEIVLKEDQRSGILTAGFVSRILTNKSEHPRGIKVMLNDGSVGRIVNLYTY